MRVFLKNIFLSKRLFIIVCGIFVLLSYSSVKAEETNYRDTYLVGQVLSITEQKIDNPITPKPFEDLIQSVESGTKNTSDQDQETIQKIKVKIIKGENVGQIIDIDQDNTALIKNLIFTVDEKVVVVKTGQTPNESYYISDVYRLPTLIVVGIIFVVLVVALARKKGLSALGGLFFTIIILSFFMIPGILAGKNPIVVTLLSSGAILFISLYLAHGFNRQTTVALVSTLFTLFLSIIFSYIFVKAGHLFGLGSEEASYLQFGPLETLNLQWLLLSGIIIGTLGVLDDITISQVSIVAELKKANSNLSRGELYSRGLSVGKEHIASLVNTLVLAYAGTSLPVFLLFKTSVVSAPLWAVFNSQTIAEEIVRTLVGSMTLVLAVPITTWLAAYYFSKHSSHSHS